MYPRRKFKRRVPIPPWMAAAMKADNDSEQKITGYMKTGDLDTALAECNSAINASAAAWGGVATPRLRHLLGAIYLTAGRYADAYRIFEDIGHHGGEFYSCDDFDMDVALAAVHVGNPRHAEFLVRRYLSRFDPNGFEGRVNLLPGFGSPAAAVATVHAVRGLNCSGSGQWEEARLELNLAAQIAPYNAYIALQRGIALHFSGHDEQAGACLEVAMRSDDPVVKLVAEGEMQSVHMAEAKGGAEAKKSAEGKITR
jgi:tetratricopeptide (TPR) repeat protein